MKDRYFNIIQINFVLLIYHHSSNFYCTSKLLQVIKMLICVIVLFLLCWGPRFILEILMKIGAFKYTVCKKNCNLMLRLFLTMSEENNCELHKHYLFYSLAFTGPRYHCLCFHSCMPYLIQSSTLSWVRAFVNQLYQNFDNAAVSCQGGVATRIHRLINISLMMIMLKWLQ